MATCQVLGAAEMDDTETVFANIKHNYYLKWFMLRGKDKVTVETRLLAHSLRKKIAASKL